MTTHSIFLTLPFVAGCAASTANVDTVGNPASDEAELTQTQPAPTPEVASGLTCEPKSNLCTEAEFASAGRGGTVVEGRWLDLAEGRGFLVMPAEIDIAFQQMSHRWEPNDDREPS